MQDPKTTLYIDAYQSGSSALAILKGRLVLENCDATRKRLLGLDGRKALVVQLDRDIDDVPECLGE